MSDTPLTDDLKAKIQRPYDAGELSYETMLTQMVGALSEHARTLERRLRELERPGYVWVPEEQLRKYELLLELAGVTGVEARHPDGTRTPNSQLCRDASDEIGAMLAASGEGR